MVAQVGDCVIMDYGSSSGGYVIMGCDVLLYKMVRAHAPLDTTLEVEV